MKLNLKDASHLLRTWYLKNRRALPWREHKDPYLIWVSEIMLQQTTVQAVIPFFNRFKAKFPSVADLAQADLADVLAHWAGLGYYSRARNLHKSAQVLAAKEAFPRSYKELILLPGFGDYTARAVSSIAFNEAVGVVDGNVIRILSRLTNKQYLWWTTTGKKTLQQLADEMVQNEDSSLINQAMMELGATVCTPSSPACPLCPWHKICEARKAGTINELPLRRPKKETKIIAVHMQLFFYKEEMALVENKTLPFLKGSLLPPSRAMTLAAKPKRYDFQHSITHHQIYVTLQCEEAKVKAKKYQWHPIVNIAKINPSSLLQKALEQSRR